MDPAIHEPGMSARCPVCGRELGPSTPPSRCPHCLLRQGLPTDPALTADETAPAAESVGLRALPQPGENLGHYRILRPLGRGGMGAVFEAEDTRSGRRVALKVLGHRLDSPEARSRFFREGRLAASVNHPNSVYVFGTEEIAGIPVIAMELVSGGTLQDRLTRQGPGPVTAVVDSVLQVIAGLEAAQRVGVLHRDIKPSNCFVDLDGTVKVGDFGLSISTLLRTEPSLTMAGAFLGTPAFASPEQLRGDEVTVRSDLYSVGVTLYYLLTGRHPFMAGNVMQLLATVLERRAESPARWRPDLPAGLCRIVLRCLEKDPERRYRSYADLRDALQPYASAAPTPATLGLRFVAHCLDNLLLALPASAFDLLVLLGPAGALTIRQALLANLFHTALWLAYFGVLEGRWGASAGKRLCRLRVTRPDRTVPGVPRAMLRALILYTVPTMFWLVARGLGEVGQPGPRPGSWMAVFSLLSLLLMALLFTTARRRNGFAGLHDLASATRVTLIQPEQPRPTLAAAPAPLPEVTTLPVIGPYHVLDRLAGAEGAELLLGFDARLLRRVWIRKLPAGSPAVPVGLRQLSRPGRLRWLGGQRTATEAWDAYEALSGQPLLALVGTPQPWGRARYWLLDLAEELGAAIQDGSFPMPPSLDRIWITNEGRAKLLDFPIPGAECPPAALVEGETLADAAGRLLGRVAMLARHGGAPESDAAATAATAVTAGQESASRHPVSSGLPNPEAPSVGRPAVRVPWPIHAVDLLEALQSGISLEEAIARLRSSLRVAAEVSRARRGALTAGAIAVPLLATLVGGGLHLYTRAVARTDPEWVTLRECLVRQQSLSGPAGSGEAEASARQEALAVYVAGRFGPIITNADRWHSLAARMILTEPLRTEAERILRRPSPPSPEEFASAAARVEALFGQVPDQAARTAQERWTLSFIVLVTGYANAVMFVIVPCLIASLLFRGGALLRLLGIVFVTQTGAPASRGRVAWRNLVAWLPFLLLPMGFRELAPWLGETVTLLLLLGGCAGLAVGSVLLPCRGLADRVAGTWLVPR